MATIRITKSATLLMPSRCEARPVTDDMRQMLDDIGRVEPLPPLVPRTLLKSFARQLAEGLDRSFLDMIHGGPHLVPHGKWKIPLKS